MKYDRGVSWPGRDGRQLWTPPAAPHSTHLTSVDAHIVGDSRMCQLDAIFHQSPLEFTRAGAGYTGTSGSPAPATLPQAASIRETTVILVASIWDAFTSDMSGYSSFDTHYTNLGATTIWVEAMYVVGGATFWPDATIDTMHANIETELGISLVSKSVYAGPLFDDVHFTPAAALAAATALNALA